MNEIMQRAAQYLGIQPEALEKLPAAVQTDMERAMMENEQNADAAYDALKVIWTDALLNKDLRDVSLVSGISMKLLNALPMETKLELMFTLSSDAKDVTELHRIVNDYLATAALPDIARLLKMEYAALKELPYETQKQLCGIFEMEYGITPDAELAASLTEAMQAGGAA